MQTLIFYNNNNNNNNNKQVNYWYKFVVKKAA